MFNEMLAMGSGGGGEVQFTTDTFSNSSAWGGGSISVPSGATYATIAFAITYRGGNPIFNKLGIEEISRLSDTYTTSSTGSNCVFDTLVKITGPTITVGFDAQGFTAQITFIYT